VNDQRQRLGRQAEFVIRESSGFLSNKSEHIASSANARSQLHEKQSNPGIKHICGIARERSQNPASFCSDGKPGLALFAVSIALA
jgi:hypothetical protein